MRSRSRILGSALLFALGVWPSTAWAQGPPAAPVKYTTARVHAMRLDVVLTGSAEPRTVSVVASEVSGAVRELPAREGDVVEKGALLARLETQALELQLDARKGGLTEAEARLARAERVLGRARDLFASNHISPEELDEAQTEFRAWEGRTHALRAEIASIDHDIARCRIRAPFSGVVVSERTEVGEWIGVGDPVVELLTLDEIDVRVDAPERYFARLRVGDAARARFESLDGLEIEGRIAALIPRAADRARTFPVKIRIANPEHRVAAGMLAEVRLGAGAVAESVIVPKDAIVPQGPMQFVYVIDGEQSVQQVPVTVGRSVGFWSVVEGDILADARVVTRGNERLRPGQKVSGEPLEYELP